MEEAKESIRPVKLQVRLSASSSPILGLISEELRLLLNAEGRQMRVGSAPWDYFFELLFNRTHMPFSQVGKEEEEARGAGSEVSEKVTTLGESELADGTGRDSRTP